MARRFDPRRKKAHSRASHHYHRPLRQRVIGTCREVLKGKLKRGEITLDDFLLFLLGVRKNTFQVSSAVYEGGFVQMKVRGPRRGPNRGEHPVRCRLGNVLPKGCRVVGT